MEILLTSVIYLPYAAVLIIALLIFPAIALFPRLLLTPSLAICIPIISLAITTGIAYGLMCIGHFSHAYVMAFTVALSIVAIVRLIFLRGMLWINKWQPLDYAKLLLNTGLILPLIALTGLGSFMFDDAMVSWNRWAMHFYLHESTYGKTGGYPQFYSLMIANAYQLSGTSLYQGPVKVLLCAFPLTLLNTLVFSWKNAEKQLWLYLPVALWCVFPGAALGFYYFYSVGYADPLFAAALLCSVMLLFNYCENNQQFTLFLATVTGIVAGLTKQPGFMWVLWGFPLLLSVKAIKYRLFLWRDAAAVLLLILPLVYWLLGDGSHFYHNQGVLLASTGQTHPDVEILLHTFLGAVNRYWITLPSVLLLYLVAGILCLRNIYHKTLYAGFILPGTVLWFVFGSYEIRLGLHLIMLCGLIIALNSDAIHIPFIKIARIQSVTSVAYWKRAAKISLILGVLLFIVFSIRQQDIQHHGVSGHIYPLNGPKTTVYYYFHDAAPFVVDNILQKPDTKLWIANGYLWAIFYGHDNLIRPVDTLDKHQVYAQLLTTLPEYIITGGVKTPASLKASAVLEKIIQQCPAQFSEIPLGNIYPFDYHLYRFDAALARKNPCFFSH